jgi:transposase
MGHMRKSRLSQHKKGRLIENFVAGTTAQTAASLCGIHRNTAAYYLLPLREIIAYELEADSEAMFGGEIEVDESYFGGKRKGKRGRGTAGKIPVVGLSLPDSGLFANHEKVKRGGKVYTKMILDVSGATLIPIIERKVVPLLGDCFAFTWQSTDSIVYSDCWLGYNVLDVSDVHHFRINHSKLFADRHNHINGIENFWNQAKRYMRKFNGVPKAHFGLFLKECEWRFNNSDPSAQLS